MATPSFVAVGAGVDQHVRREGGEARGHLPDVQLVEVGQAVETADRGLDGGRLEATRGGFEEDPGAVA